MNSHNSLNTDSSNVKFSQILRLEPWFYQIHTTYVPFIAWLSFFKSDIATSFKLSFKSADAGLVDISKFFVDGIENLFDVIDLFLFQLINFL